MNKHMDSLKLYIASPSRSTRAITSDLNRVLENVATGGQFDLEVISVLDSPERAMADNVMVTPTIIRATSPSETRVTGNFSDIMAVMRQLGLTETASSGASYKMDM